MRKSKCIHHGPASALGLIGLCGLSSLFVLLGIGAGPVAVAQQTGSALPAATDWEKRSDQRFEKLEAGKTLTVRNPFGSVFARFGGYELETEILTTTQRIDTDLPELEVHFERNEGALLVRVARKAAKGQATSDTRGRDRVDLVFFVPLDVPFDVETRDGGVEMKGVKSDIRVRTESGDIRLRSIQGAIRAQTDRGEIGVSLDGDPTGKDLSFESVTGDIEVYAWEDMNLDARLATSGFVTTDFSVEIENRKFEEPSKHAGARLGKGGPTLRMTSKRGNLRLLRLIRDFRPEGSGGAAE